MTSCLSTIPAYESPSENGSTLRRKNLLTLFSRVANFDPFELTRFLKRTNNFDKSSFSLECVSFLINYCPQFSHSVKCIFQFIKLDDQSLEGYFSHVR